MQHDCNTIATVMQLSPHIIYQISISMKTIQLSLLETLNSNSKKIRESRDQNKTQHSNCGFGLCPKKYKYLANPQLLDEIFSMSNSGWNQIGSEKVFVTKQNIFETIDVKRSICRPNTEDSPFDSMRTTNCIGCNQKYLLRVDNPICVSCRGIY